MTTWVKDANGRAGGGSGWAEEVGVRRIKPERAGQVIECGG